MPQPRGVMVGVTAQGHAEALGRLCPICGTPLTSTRATFCSHSCQMVGFRRRRARQRLAAEVNSSSIAPVSPDQIVYACPGCETRYLGVQRCEACNRFCRRLGVGGSCPGCDDIIALEELLAL